MDDLDVAQQPRCPECWTVLVDVRRGFECRGCGLVFIGDALPG